MLFSGTIIEVSPIPGLENIRVCPAPTIVPIPNDSFGLKYISRFKL